MKKTILFNLKDIKSNLTLILDKLIINRKQLLLTLMVVLGLWCGTALYKTNDSISLLAENAIRLLISSGALRLFIIILIINSVALFLTFVSGFSAVGIVTVIIIPCFYGMILGFLNSYVYNTYNLNGVIFSVVTIIPFAVATMLLLIISCNEALVISGSVVKAIFFYEPGNRGEVKAFLLKQVTVFAITAAVTLLQSLIVSNLGEKILNI